MKICGWGISGVAWKSMGRFWPTSIGRKADMTFDQESVQGLLMAYSEILRELRRRNLIRSANNPIADIAETLVAVALKLELTSGSTTGHDAKDINGVRYEIKGRRIT